MRLISTLLISLFSVSVIVAQEDEKPVEISFHGFVSLNAGYNSRTSKQVRNNSIYLYPLPQKLNEDEDDLNARGSFDLGASHSRFGMHIKGPTFNGISVSGLLEADFLGDDRASDSDLRLRHAYLSLSYKKFVLTAGQTFHPLHISDASPKTVNTVTGIPMHPLSRNPQLRFAWQLTSGLDLSATLLRQNNSRSTGFFADNNDRGIPEFVLQTGIGGQGALKVYLTAGYKQLSLPDEYDPHNEKLTMDAFHFQTSLRYKSEKLEYRMAALYGDNLTEMVMPGGVGRINRGTEENPEYEYKGLPVVGLWADLSTKCDKWSPGLFAGYLEATGTRESIDEVLNDFSRDSEIQNILIVAPRLNYLMHKNLTASFEYMWTRAGWGAKEDLDNPEGDKYNNHGVPLNVENFANHRLLFSITYSF